MNVTNVLIPFAINMILISISFTIIAARLLWLICTGSSRDRLYIFTLLIIVVIILSFFV